MQQFSCGVLSTWRFLLGGGNKQFATTTILRLSIFHGESKSPTICFRSEQLAGTPKRIAHSSMATSSQMEGWKHKRSELANNRKRRSTSLCKGRKLSCEPMQNQERSCDHKTAGRAPDCKTCKTMQMMDKSKRIDFLRTFNQCEAYKTHIMRGNLTSQCDPNLNWLSSVKENY